MAKLQKLYLLSPSLWERSMRLSKLSGLVFILAAGCGGGDAVLYEQGFEVPLDGKKTSFTTPKEGKKIQIAVSARDAVNVYVFREADEALATKEVQGGVVTTRVLAHKERTTEATFEPSLRPSERVVVFVTRAAGKVTVAGVKVTAKK